MKHCLLDSSFVIDLLNEIASGKAGAALDWLRRNSTAELWISPVTLAEVLEGADDADAVKDYLRRYSWQGIHRVHADIVAKLQRRASRRMGENDAWQAAVAAQMGAVLVGHDAKAFKRLGAAYEDHRRK
ncbi:MAG: type II toxin-antitoxin system VapC family toxin [Steroidobacteraceae bacterium]